MGGLLWRASLLVSLLCLSLLTLLRFTTEGGKQQQRRLEELHWNASNAVHRSLIAADKPALVVPSSVPWRSVPLTNPFVPAACAAQSYSAPKAASVAVIIPARNEDPVSVQMTAQSILENSGSELRGIWIVDDGSGEPLDHKLILPNPSRAKVQLLRNVGRIGVAGSKAKGAAAAIEHGAEVLVFVDAHCVVSAQWLRPILSTLAGNPQSLVYPGLDAIDPKSGKLIRGEEAVATIDLTLEVIWKRVRADTAQSQPQLSPVAPGIFAVTKDYYSKLGGMPTDLFPFGLESVDLSLKSWLCGGGVIRDPCSRVAHAFWGVADDVYVRNGVTEMDVHRNALIVAGTVMGGKDMESLVRKARFMSKPAFDVDVPSSLAGRMFNVRKNLQCQSFDWFVENLAPNLQTQMLDVRRMWTEEANKARTAAALAPLLQQYTKETLAKPDAGAQLVEHLAERQPGSAKAQEEAQKRARSAQHIEKVKAGLCEDFDESCAASAKAGDCKNTPETTLFLCPKSCNRCGTDGKFCSDLYLTKCPIWAKNGNCETKKDFMHINCRYSCKVCEMPGEGQRVHVAQQPQQPQAQAERKPGQRAWDESQLGVHPYMDPATARRAWEQGLLKGPAGDGCSMNKHHKAVLKNVRLATMSDAAAKIRLLCITYTTEEHHKTHVTAIRSTWGKRCDGHIVISTADDPSLNAVGVPHKGPEEYNNVWQKLRAGWAYVARHYIDNFDWFYIGGNDAFVIVENLKSYLASDEIVSASKDGTEPLFVGRRFKLPSGNIFNSGGAGYLLNRPALKIVERALPTCKAAVASFAEDVMMADCLREHASIVPYETKDAAGRERFHPFTPQQHYLYKIPKDPKSNDWYSKYSIDLKEGTECCSDESISFHYVAPSLMNDIYGYIYQRTQDC